MSAFCCHGFLHSIDITEMYRTRHPTSNNTIISLTVIYYSLLDYGNGFDLKGSKCVFWNGGEGGV